ncbi:tail fiber domain-containing protein [Enterococcus cecorum]|uniref:Tail fiber domain-containing protein n=1 Tax=Enterococcus cecorum TaxID=44008 RepID=A0AAW8TX40_9ENTE|nr:tail fiber domain-containing protein [Enterococcus cecorum]MDT2797425.1 tail fiber domain-containing protein [Enterococcus cecorum]
MDLKYYSKTQIVDVGMRLAFVFRGKDYWTTVTSVSRESEYEYQVEARSLSLEALREVRSSYKASRNMTFEEYLNVFDPEHSIRLNVNTISDRSRKLEWTGEDTILARILSLATKFDAEIAFETELNDDYSLKEFRLNVHALNELGKDRTGMPFRISNSQLKLIKFKSSIDEFYSAIRGTGKDGLSISGLDKKVYDDEKKLLFYTSGGTIYAPQARDKFISITNKKTSDGYIVREFDSTEHATKEALYAYMLGELKKHCEPQIDYTIDGYIDADVNDKVLLIDDKYTTDDLMLTARVNKQKWSLIDKLQGNNRTELSNYVRVYSEIADELITRMNALIEANKVYDVQILTTNGYSFKNGQGSTTLTARVMDGPKDVTNEFSLTWFKNSAEYSHDASINVQAGSIDELATYLIITEKDGRERGRNELTVFNVKDGQPGKTPVVHLAWADSADGSVGFTLELPTTKIPKYRGYYVDYSTVASTNPKLYKWERNPDDAAKVADEAKDKADSANSKADSAVSVATDAKNTADEASKQTVLVNELANTAKKLADKANADAAEANRLIGLANGEIDRLNTDVSTAKSDLASAEAELNSKIETVKTTLTQNYATKTNLSDTQITLNKTISDSVASVKQEMSETYAVKSDLTTLQGDYDSFKEQTAQKISQQVSSIQTIQTDTTEAQKLANDAYSKAQNAVTSATNANSTASSAMNKASDATSIANSASQNASNAVASANSAVSTANTAKSNADKAIADVASLTKTVSSQSTRIDQTSSRIEQVASGVTEVGTRLDNLQIGGRNLALNSGVVKTNINYCIGEYFISPSEGNVLSDGHGCLVEGKKYTAIVCITTDSTVDGIMLYLSQGWRKLEHIHVEKNKKQVVSSDFVAVYYDGRTPKDDPAYAILQLYRYPNPENPIGAQYVTVHWVKIVDASGVVVKDWSPAPEDQQSQIDSINTNLSNNYYAKTTVDSKLSTAVSGITAQYTQDITTRLGNYYDKATIDSKLTIDGQGIASYVKNTQSQLNNLSIGSDNLIINGGNITDISPWQPRYKDKFGIYKHPFYYNGEKNIFRLDTTSTTDENYVNSNRFEVKRNTDYTLSFIGFYNSNIRSAEILFLGRKSTETNVQYSYVKSMPLVLSNGSAVYKTITFNSGDNDTGYIRIDNNGTLSEGNLSTLYFGEVMLVEGNVAKKYQPSSAEFPTLTQYSEVKQLADRISSTVYDGSTGLTTKVNQLAGKYAITALNSAGDILASLNLNANTSTAEINAKLIRLNGSTKMDDAFVNKLVANSIVTNKIKSTEISGDIIRGGTIQGVTLKSTGSGAEPGEVEINDGTIAMEKQEVGTTGRFFNRGFVSPLEMTMSKVGPVGGKIGLIRATSFTPFGFNNQALDTGNNVQTHRLYFHYQGLSIESDGANSGVGRNSGLKIFGDNAYIDLKSGILNDPGNDSDPIKMRIIATPNNTFEFRNNYGNIYMMTKNGEQPIANGYKLIYTWGTPNDMSVRHIRMINPTSSSPYAEIQNNAGTAFGMNVWKSDQRLKSNIQSPTQDALATLNQLQVRQFDWKSDNVHEDFGLIAQEVEQILPNAVFKVGDYYQIKDSGLIPVLIGAVQKLSNKVNLLENIIYNIKGGNLI